MLGIIVQILISWLIIWLFERGNLSFFGLRPTGKRLAAFLLFLVVTALCCASGFLLRRYAGKEHWIVNPSLNLKLVMDGLLWNVKSVLFEELIFRGVILYILIKKIGSTIAVVISAIAFGIYHWFSFGVFGNIPQMIIVFLITGAMGLVLAYGYAKMGSLYISIGIHLGWNVTQTFIFSQGPIGNGVFMNDSLQPFRTGSYFLFFTVTLLPIISALLVNFLMLRRTKVFSLQPGNSLPGDNA